MYRLTQAPVNGRDPPCADAIPLRGTPGSRISLPGIAPDLRGRLGEQAAAQLASLLGQLEEPEFCDIAIRPFTVNHQGVTFGPIDESDPDRGDWAELHPGRPGMNPPWDGAYST